MGKYPIRVTSRNPRIIIIQKIRSFSKALIRAGAFAITDILSEKQIENMLKSCMK